jgi:hypothetical protein
MKGHLLKGLGHFKIQVQRFRVARFRGSGVLGSAFNATAGLKSIQFDLRSKLNGMNLLIASTLIIK